MLKFKDNVKLNMLKKFGWELNYCDDWTEYHYQQTRKQQRILKHGGDYIYIHSTLKDGKEVYGVLDEYRIISEDVLKKYIEEEIKAGLVEEV